MTLEWDNPDDSSITEYEYQRRTGDGGSWSTTWTSMEGTDANTTSFEFNLTSILQRVELDAQILIAGADPSVTDPRHA